MKCICIGPPASDCPTHGDLTVPVLLQCGEIWLLDDLPKCHIRLHCGHCGGTVCICYAVPENKKAP